MLDPQMPMLSPDLYPVFIVEITGLSYPLGCLGGHQEKGSGFWVDGDSDGGSQGFQMSELGLWNADPSFSHKG